MKKTFFISVVAVLLISATKSKKVAITTTPTKYYTSAADSNYISYRAYNYSNYQIRLYVKVGQKVDSFWVPASPDTLNINYTEPENNETMMMKGDSVVAWCNRNGALQGVLWH